MTEKRVEWEVEVSFIKRLTYARYDDYKYIPPLNTYLTVELITGVTYYSRVPIEWVTDLLSADNVGGHFEHYIQREFRKGCRRTLPEPDPAYGTTGRFSKYRNWSAFDEAFAEAKKVAARPGDNSQWVAEKHARIACWIEEIAGFAPEVAERERLRIADAAPSLAAEVAEEERKAKQWSELMERNVEELRVLQERHAERQAEEERKAAEERQSAEPNVEELRVLQERHAERQAEEERKAAEERQSAEPNVEELRVLQERHAERQAEEERKAAEWNQRVAEMAEKLRRKKAAAETKRLFDIAEQTRRRAAVIQRTGWSEEQMTKYEKLCTRPVSENIPKFWWLIWIVCLAGWMLIGSSVARANHDSSLLVFLVLLFVAWPLGAWLISYLFTWLRKAYYKQVVKLPVLLPIPQLVRTASPPDYSSHKISSAQPLPVEESESVATSEVDGTEQRRVHDAESAFDGQEPFHFPQTTEQRGEILSVAGEVITPDFEPPQPEPSGGQDQQGQPQEMEVVTLAEIPSSAEEDFPPNEPPPSEPREDHDKPTEVQSEAVADRPNSQMELEALTRPLSEEPISAERDTKPTMPAEAPQKPPASAPPVVRKAGQRMPEAEERIPSPIPARGLPPIDLLAEPLIPVPALEGQRRLRKNYEVVRNPKLRDMAIQIHGRDCCVCGFNFNEFFGDDLARGYVEVHHLKNIADGERTTDPSTDLAPLCANCHAMADRLAKTLETPPTSIAELRKLLLPSREK